MGDSPDRALWGDFEVDFDALLGRGGMGAVYKARQISLDRPVAVKVLEPDRAPNDELATGFVEKFEVEAKALAKLNDPRIVTILQAGRNDGRCWYAMELVDGETLDDRLQRDGMLEPREAARVAAEVARALAAALREGIVHRDVKPANIFLTRDGNVKLADFGLARSAGFQPTKFTKMNAVAATPEYASPEQAANGACDHRSDQYSLGAVLFELVTERPPFGGASAVETLFQQVHQDPPRPSSLNPKIPPGLEAVILRCLRKDPSDRYPTYEELVRDLEAVAADAAPVSIPKREREKPVLVYAAAGFVVVLLLGVLAWARPWERAPEVPRKTPAPTATPIATPWSTPVPTPAPTPDPTPDPRVEAERKVRGLLAANRPIEAYALMKAEGLDLPEVPPAARKAAWAAVDPPDRGTLAAFLAIEPDARLADELAAFDAPFEHPASRAFERAVRALYDGRNLRDAEVGEIRSWKAYPGSDRARWDLKPGLRLHDPERESWLAKALGAERGVALRFRFAPSGAGAWAGLAAGEMSRDRFRMLQVLATGEGLVAGVVEREGGKVEGRGETPAPAGEEHEFALLPAGGRWFAFIDGRYVASWAGDGPGAAVAPGVHRGELVITGIQVAR